jgi:hypothetical protein
MSTERFQYARANRPDTIFKMAAYRAMLLAKGVTRTRDGYCRMYFCTRQFSVSATKISSRGLIAM